MMGLEISEKKYSEESRKRLNNWFVPAEFRLFRGTENSRNPVPNHSAEQKNARNSVLWNKKRSKHSEFLSKPFRGREKTWNSVPRNKNRCKHLEFYSNHSAKEKTNRNSVPWNKNRSKLSEFHSEGFRILLSILFSGAGFCCKTHFFPVIPFRSVLRN
jgi:hypothetical protein